MQKKQGMHAHMLSRACMHICIRQINQLAFGSVFTNPLCNVCFTSEEAPDLKLKLNRPATTCAQDGGNKSSDQTSKTEGKVSPSVQDRLLPSGHLTKVASSHELRKKVDDLQTTKLVSSARRKSSSSSKSEEKSDRLNASLKIPPSKDGRTVVIFLIK